MPRRTGSYSVISSYPRRYMSRERWWPYCWIAQRRDLRADIHTNNAWRQNMVTDPSGFRRVVVSGPSKLIPLPSSVGARHGRLDLDPTRTRVDG